MKTFINWLKKPSISRKLIVSFIAILIIPILILEFSSYRSASESWIRKLWEMRKTV